MILQWHQ